MAASHVQQAQQLRQQLEAAKVSLANAANVGDCAHVVQKALEVAQAAATKLHEMAPKPAPKAAPQPEPCVATPADIQTKDDGNAVTLFNLPAGWSNLRTKAFAERFRLAVSNVEKQPGWTFAVLQLTSMEHLDEASALLAGQTVDGQRAVKLRKGVAVPGQEAAAAAPGQDSKPPSAAAPLPPAGSSGAAGGVPAPPPSAAATSSSAEAGTQAVAPAAACGGGRKRGADGKAAPAAKQPRTDIRDCVCPWWARPYGEQLRDKAVTIATQLRAITSNLMQRSQNPPAWLAAAHAAVGQACCPLLGIVRSPQIEGYRNKNEFTIGLDRQERPTVGFLLGAFVEGYTAVAEPRGCRHTSKTSIAYAAIVQSFLRQHSALPPWDKRSNSGFWRLLVVREGRERTFLPPPPVQAAAAAAAGAASGGSAPAAAAGGAQAFESLQPGSWLVGLDEASLASVSEAEPVAPPPDSVLLMVQINPGYAAAPAEAKDAELSRLAAFVAAEAAASGLPAASLLLQHHTGVSNAAPADAPLALPAGAAGSPAGAAIRDALCDLSFRISPTAFFQVNSPCTCLLYAMAGEWAAARPGTLVLDICCGTGTIGLTVARRVARVVGVDITASAIEDAKANCDLNCVSNCSFVCDKAEDAMASILRQHAGSYEDVVAICDPPRAGLHKSVLRALRGCAALKRLVFIACNPASLADNVTQLCSSGGGGVPFRPVKAVAVDLFPHTAHVESMMLLER